ncbi:tetratricopeptide repeat protein [Paenibacillus pinistramenti]|uniref:tetratricopeptide repeat protein n=1 Tax=Paenibacillus pinistramenti TaxID=1768003 RepID=UPI0011084FC3|nr:tetratricopeptide repeat protein [Paenibacillus pinistramenti]
MHEQEAYQAGYTAVQQLIQWQRYKEALAEAQELLKLEPEDPDVFAMIAHIYLLMSEYEKALHWASEALRRNPEEQLAWFVRVNVYYETDNESSFQSALQEALRVDPYEAHYYFLQANRLNKKARFHEAKEELVRALELQPEAPLYLATLSYTEALLGKDGASRELEREALRYGAEMPYVLLYLAWAAGRRGDFKLRETYIRSAVRLNPDSRQFQDEYLEALQQNHKLFRVFLWPSKWIRRLKGWQLFLIWAAAWLLFRPLVIVFILLYVLAHWLSKLIVHVKVFGWRRRR